jgi:D-amino-acid oxidase
VHPDVLVVGAGVSGLTTAVRLAESGRVVQVIASEPPAASTSAVAGAVTAGPAFADPVADAHRWDPFDAALAWHHASLATFADLATCPGTGVRVAHGRMVSRGDPGRSPAMRSLPDYRSCTPAEAAGFPVAFWMSLPIIDMPTYLGYLRERLSAGGGGVTIETLRGPADAAARAPVVVNCTGTGARRFAADPAVYPIRGQHVVLENPGLEEFLFEFGPSAASTSFIPHGSRLICGGTGDPHAWSRQPVPEQTEGILARCAAVEPRIAGARIAAVEVGLRAGRPRMRVGEAETVGGSTMIHNYGHGSVAVSLSWGCAEAVYAIVAGRDPSQVTPAETALATTRPAERGTR